VKISGPENYKEICMTKEEHAGMGVGVEGSGKRYSKRGMPHM
jgi:hypothetical protein